VIGYLLNPADQMSALDRRARAQASARIGIELNVPRRSEGRLETAFRRSGKLGAVASLSPENRFRHQARRIGPFRRGARGGGLRLARVIFWLAAS